jgi:hypothetical protein
VISETVIAVAGILGTAGGLGGAYAGVMSWLDSRGSRRSEGRSRAVTGAVQEGVRPLEAAQASLGREVAALGSECHRIAQAVEHNSVTLSGLSDRVVALETKMEVFWRNVGVALAGVLHSPDPRRAHVDALLEALMEDRMTPPEREELRALLTYIKDHHPGDSSDFPIHGGDQVAAAILLETMGFASAGRR